MCVQDWGPRNTTSGVSGCIEGTFSHAMGYFRGLWVLGPISRNPFSELHLIMGRKLRAILEYLYLREYGRSRLFVNWWSCLLDYEAFTLFLAKDKRIWQRRCNTSNKVHERIKIKMPALQHLLAKKQVYKIIVLCKDPCRQVHV